MVVNALASQQEGLVPESGSFLLSPGSPNVCVVHLYMRLVTCPACSPPYAPYYSWIYSLWMYLENVLILTFILELGITVLLLIPVLLQCIILGRFIHMVCCSMFSSQSPSPPSLVPCSYDLLSQQTATRTSSVFWPLFGLRV